MRQLTERPRGHRQRAIQVAALDQRPDVATRWALWHTEKARRVAEDERLGPSFEARKEWLRTLVQITRRKIELIVDNLDGLLEVDPA